MHYVDRGSFLLLLRRLRFALFRGSDVGAEPDGLYGAVQLLVVVVGVAAQRARPGEVAGFVAQDELPRVVARDSES